MNDRGIAQRSLFVLKFGGPAVLVEAGFIDNKGDVEKLTKNNGQIGKEIASGITKFVKGLPK